VYKVRRKPCGLSGSPAIVIDPPAWCVAARTLCAGAWRSPSLVEKLLSGGGIKVTKGAWQVPMWLAFVASKVVLLERLGDQELILLCECFNNVYQGWLSAYRYHRINCLSRVCFLSSPYRFRIYSIAIFACLYFPRVVS
jgi:hypothetical protein